MGAEKHSILIVLFIIKKSKLLKNGEAPSNKQVERIY